MCVMMFTKQLQEKSQSFNLATKMCQSNQLSSSYSAKILQYFVTVSLGPLFNLRNDASDYDNCTAIEDPSQLFEVSLAYLKDAHPDSSTIPDHYP